MTTMTTERPESAGIAWGPLAWIAVLHLGALLAFVPAYFTWQALLVCVALHWLTGCVGITMTYHRLLTHRSFATRPKWLEYALICVGCAASEGGPISWVADHRRHHAHSDEDDDVHSPNRGFAWAHMLWWMTPDVVSMHSPAYFQRWVPDLLRDKNIVFIHKIHFLFPILSAVLLYAIGGMPWLVWGFFVRSITVLHATWLVNSATHIWGYRTHETRDTSTNLWWVAIVTYGEGWHNNHHAYQTSARHGLRWWEVDVTYMVIRALSLVGLAHSIKYPKIIHAAPVGAEVVMAGHADEERELVGASAN